MAHLLEREILIHIGIVVYLEMLVAKSPHKLGHRMALGEAMRELGALPCMYKTELEGSKR